MWDFVAKSESVTRIKGNRVRLRSGLTAPRFNLHTRSRVRCGYGMLIVNKSSTSSKSLIQRALPGADSGLILLEPIYYDPCAMAADGSRVAASIKTTPQVIAGSSFGTASQARSFGVSPGTPSEWRFRPMDLSSPPETNGGKIDVWSYSRTV